MLAEASNACFYAADVPRMLAAAERACELLPPDGNEGEAASLAALAHGMALVLVGRRAAGAAVRSAHGAGAARDRPRCAPIPSLLAFAAMGPVWLREDDGPRARRAARWSGARARRPLGVLPVLLLAVARMHARDRRTLDDGRRRSTTRASDWRARRAS